MYKFRKIIVFFPFCTLITKFFDDLILNLLRDLVNTTQVSKLIKANFTLFQFLTGFISF